MSNCRGRQIQRIVHGGAAARTQSPDSARERFRVVGEVLGHFRGDIETDDERFVIAGPDRLVEKLNRRFLLELETVPDGVAGIDQQPDLQRQIRFIMKAANLLGRLAVIDYRKIALRQVPYVAAMLIGHGEYDVHFIYCFGNRGGGVIAGVGGLASAAFGEASDCAGSGLAGSESAGDWLAIRSSRACSLLTVPYWLAAEQAEAAWAGCVLV